MKNQWPLSDQYIAHSNLPKAENSPSQLAPQNANTLSESTESYSEHTWEELDLESHLEARKAHFIFLAGFFATAIGIILVCLNLFSETVTVFFPYSIVLFIIGACLFAQGISQVKDDHSWRREQHTI